MAIAPWRATCIQIRGDLAAKAPDRRAARSIIEANVQRAVSAIGAVCTGDPGRKPALALLPEFGLQGPPHGENVAEWIDKACDSVPGEITAPLQDIARRHGIFIGANQFEASDRWPGRYFNCSYLIDPNGAVILRYRRINTALWTSPHDLMDDYMAAEGIEGTFPVVDTELGRIAMIPCGEIAVPEVARVLTLRGAEVILHPTNEPESIVQEAAKVSRAAENMAYVISTNIAGGIGFSWDGSVLGGRSRIVNFYGETICMEDRPGESMEVSAIIDVEALRAARRDTGLRNTLLYARFDMYRPLYAAAVHYPPNQFLTKPMKDKTCLAPVVEKALGNLRRSGVLQD